MRLWLLTAALTLVGTTASAQTGAELRSWQAQDNLLRLEQSQRLGEIERQLSNIELRQKSEQVLREMAGPPPVTTATANPYTPVYSYSARAARLTDENRLRDAELAASNARLKAIAEQQRR